MTQVNILWLVSDMISILSGQKFHHLGVGLRAETLHEDLNEIMRWMDRKGDGDNGGGWNIRVEHKWV